MKRRQCIHAASALKAATPDMISEATRSPTSGNIWAANAPNAKATPPTKPASKRMEGSAMRRWRVKYSARPQLTAATSAPDMKEG